MEEEQKLNEFANGRKKKFTGGNASKRHRDRVNVEFNNLAQLLPFSESVIAKLDKSSILRLAVSYIRAKSFFKGASMKALRRETLSSLIKEGTGAVTKIFSKALDGFLLVLTEDMKVLFVTESVRDYLGYCQAGIIHESFLQFVNPVDQSVIENNVNFRMDECESKNNIGGTHKEKSPPVPRRFVCRMKCAFSCSSRFYTAYRAFQFSGHLRKSTIQEGRQERTLNTLVVFATPLNSNNNNTSTTSVATKNTFDFNNNKPTCILESSPGERHKEMSTQSLSSTTTTGYPSGAGFRIDPTLRPHVAPIPVSAKEQTEFLCETTHNNNNDAMALRVPPSLLSVSELKVEPSSLKASLTPSQQSRPLPTLIKREHYSPPPAFFLAKSRVYPSSVDSIYSSDQSDDSKPSPVSSPNMLLLKQQHKENKLVLPPPPHLRVTPPLSGSDAISSMYRPTSSTVTTIPYESAVDFMPWAAQTRYSPPRHHPLHNSRRQHSRYPLDTHQHRQRHNEYSLHDSLLDYQQRSSEMVNYSNTSPYPADRFYSSERDGTLTSSMSSPSNSFSYSSSRKRYLTDGASSAPPHVTIAEHAHKRMKRQMMKDEDDDLLRKRNKFNISSLLGLEEKPILPKNTHSPVV